MDQYQQHRHPPNCHCTCPLPAISKTHFLFPPRSIFSSLDRGGLSISAYEKIAFRFLSFPLFHLSLYPFLSPRPAMHSSQTSHSAVSSSVDASLHFPRTPLPTPSSLSLSNSAICPPSVLCLASAMLKQPLRFLLLPLPQPAAPSAGAVARGTSLPTRDEDHATLCDPLAVAAGQAVCASLAFSIAAPRTRTHCAYIPPIPPPDPVAPLK